MVKPRDHDVVFMADGVIETSTAAAVAVDLGPATPQSRAQSQAQSQSTTLSLSETTGNRIYKQLLREYYDRYFHPVHGTPMEQNRIRKILLEGFHDRTGGSVAGLSNRHHSDNDNDIDIDIDHDVNVAHDNDHDIDQEVEVDVEANYSAQRRLAMSPLGSNSCGNSCNTPTTPTSTSTSAVAVATSPSKPQFLVYRKQGKSFCFTQVFFKRNIDQKIKESFERMRRSDVESRLELDLNDKGPVGVSGTPPPATYITNTTTNTTRQNTNTNTTTLAATDSATVTALLGNDTLETHDNPNTNEGKHAVSNHDVMLRTTSEAMESHRDRDREATPPPSTEDHQGNNQNACDDELTVKDIAVSRTEGLQPLNDGPSTNNVVPPPRNQKEKDMTIEHNVLESNNRQTMEAAAAAAAIKVSIQHEHHPDVKLPTHGTEGTSQAAKGAGNENANENEKKSDSETTDNQGEETVVNSRVIAGAEQQAAGCGTGETGHTHPDHNYNTSRPRGKRDVKIMGSSSQTEIQTNIPTAQRKRKRNFIWKGNDERPTNTKGPASDQKEESPAMDVTPKVNTSNWRKLQALFRWSSSPPLPQKVASKQNPSGPTNPDESPTGAAESERNISNGSRSTTRELEPMPHILVSPYEGNRSAEVGEEPLEEWKDMMKPLKMHKRNSDNDSDDDKTNAMNPLLSKLYGDPLALTIFKARSVITGLDPLFETSWKGGKIGGLNLGWIPKRQLLLCLSENKIGAQPIVTTPAKGGRHDDSNERNRESDNDEDTENSHSDHAYDETEALQRVVRKLECFKLVLAAMKEWKLKYDYPELYSTKDGTEFVFRKSNENESENEETNLEYNNNHEETKRNCYKCQIFVARVFATLLLFNKEQNVGTSLLGKVRACLEILNKHVRAHPNELGNLLKKKIKLELKAAGEFLQNRTTPSKRKSQHNQTHHRKTNKRSRRKIEGTYEEREATLGASFAMVKKESETLLEMMDYYKSRLLLVKVKNGNGEKRGHQHPCLSEEIAAILKRESAKEERRRKKIALARLRRSSKMKK